MRINGFRKHHNPTNTGEIEYVANIICDCGADLFHGQKFCHECGQKQDWKIDAPVKVNGIEVDQLILSRIKEKYANATRKAEG